MTAPASSRSLERRTPPPPASLPHDVTITLAFARYRTTATDSRRIAKEADKIRDAEQIVHGRAVLDDFDRWERAKGRVLLRAAETLRAEQIAAARAAGEDRCPWCTGLVLDSDVEPIAGKLVHVDHCLPQYDAFTRGEG